MTSIEAKITAKRDAWIKSEAAKMAAVVEAEQLASFIKPDLEGRIREWIKEEVEKQIKAAVSKNTDLVDHDDDEEFVHMISNGHRINSHYLNMNGYMAEPPKLVRQ